MRRIREVLRLKYECGLSHRSISASTGMSKGSVNDYLRRADEAGITWEQARELDDAAVESQLFTAVGRSEPPERAPLDLEWVRREMRKTGGGGQQRPYQYSQFCELHRRFEAKFDLVMRQDHRAGERLFIDYSGKRPTIWNPTATR